MKSLAILLLLLSVQIHVNGQAVGSEPAKQSTRSANVKILSENFSAPQLNTTRRIWIYLPPDYVSSRKKYPVLYMHDGQNLFDDKTSFAGEWQIDEALDNLRRNRKIGNCRWHR